MLPKMAKAQALEVPPIHFATLKYPENRQFLRFDELFDRLIGQLSAMSLLNIS
jgi:hypothetical protein